MCVCSPKSDIDQVMRFDADRALLKQHFTPSLVEVVALNLLIRDERGNLSI